MSTMMTMESTQPGVNLERHSLLQMIMGFRQTQLLYVAARLGIADLLTPSARNVSDLAHECQCAPEPLYRYLRALSCLDIVIELPQQYFELTSLGEGLRNGGRGSLRDVALLYGEPWMWHAYGLLLDSVRTGAPAFETVHGKKFFDYLADRPNAAKTFNAAMTSFSEQEVSSVLMAYDFSPCRVVADIGGGYGRLLSAVLRSYPTLQGILFDLPEVTPGAQHQLGQAGLYDRTQIVPGDFFRGVPAGADLYMLKSVLHDWDDDRARMIVASCRAAMSDGSRMLVIERLIGDRNQPTESKLFDVNMLAMLGGRERTAAELRMLLRSAGLRVTRVIPTGGALSLIEAVVG